MNKKTLKLFCICITAFFLMGVFLAVSFFMNWKNIIVWISLIILAYIICVWKIKQFKKYKPKMFNMICYDNLVDFAYKCNKQKSEVVSCSVICEYDSETSKYKITQIGLNTKGKAVVDGENIIGRKVVGNSIDDKIKLLCSNTFPYMFDIPISKNETKNFNKEPKKQNFAGVGTVSYDDLVEFAYECNKQKTEIVSCSVICEYDSETSKYKITQIGLNAKGKAVVDGEKTFGRKIIANSIDDKIKLLCSNTFPSMFEIPISKNETKNFNKEPKKQNSAGVGTVSYDDLVDFAYECNKQKSEVVSCTVVCEYDLETSKYKITQIGLNAKGKAVVDGEKTLGRKIIANSIDDKIKLLCSNTFPSMFEIPLLERNNRGK